MSSKKEALSSQNTWLITGVAGFIGSSILKRLLELNQKVYGYDNFITGFKKNIEDVKNSLTEEKWKNFKFIEGDIRDISSLNELKVNIDFILHQAALGSVPRSIKNPIRSSDINISGFLNILNFSKNKEIKKFVYASSSSVYGDHERLPKIENLIGNQLSPYAITKRVNEMYANNFEELFEIKTIGLRYFNVFGPRQDPDGAYAAVIPKWINAMINNDDVFINGDGTTSRDFCFVENVVDANILSAICPNQNDQNIFNIACGDRTSLFQLFNLLKDAINANGINYKKEPILRDFREGDVLHSLADISLSRNILGYNPKFNVATGIPLTVKWFLENR